MRIRRVTLSKVEILETVVTEEEINTIRAVYAHPSRPKFKCDIRRLDVNLGNHPAYDSKTVLMSVPTSSQNPLVSIVNNATADLYTSKEYLSAVAEVFAFMPVKKAVHEEGIPIDQVLFDLGSFSYILAPIDEGNKLEFRILTQAEGLEFKGDFFLPLTNRGYPYLSATEVSLRGEDKSKDFDAFIVEFKTVEEADKFRNKFNQGVSTWIKSSKNWRQEGDTWILE